MNGRFFCGYVAITKIDESNEKKCRNTLSFSFKINFMQYVVIELNASEKSLNIRRETFERKGD